MCVCVWCGGVVFCCCFFVCFVFCLNISSCNYYFLTRLLGCNFYLLTFDLRLCSLLFLLLFLPSEYFLWLLLLLSLSLLLLPFVVVVVAETPRSLDHSHLFLLSSLLFSLIPIAFLFALLCSFLLLLASIKIRQSIDLLPAPATPPCPSISACVCPCPCGGCC